VKLVVSIKEVIALDEELSVGCLVKSSADENATGMVIEFLSAEEILILWSIPPKRNYTSREIW
jgi:hypothetical protein